VSPPGVGRGTAIGICEGLMIDATRVLVVDEEPQAARALGSVLTSHGYEVSTSPDGESALSSVAEWRPHLVLTDWSMPHMDGPELCRRIRAVSRVPIIVLSGERAEQAKVEALDSGADDYLTKPFGAPELIARVKALMRRAKQYTKEATTPSFTTGDLTIDFSQHQALREDQPINLTPTEYRILAHLARNAGRVVTQDELLTKVWGPAYRDEAHLLRVNIARLRQKVEPEPSNPRYVITRPGIGYSLNRLGEDREG
jgi:two-component system, OmpR family, KDP operon response regulator KdpE